MGIVKTIYNAPVVQKFITENEGRVVVAIRYNNNYKFFGAAQCAEEDMDFFSRKIGYQIALSRARIRAMRYEKEKIAEEVDWKRRICSEITREKKVPEVTRNYQNAKRRLNAINKALKQELKTLDKYLTGQQKAIESVRIMRGKNN